MAGDNGRCGAQNPTSLKPMSLVNGPELYGPPKPRTPATFDLRQEPGAGKPHAGICAGGAQ